jgi:septum formation protein
MFDRKLILASQSPRRKQLLAEAGFVFDIKASDVEETYPDTLNVREVPEFLAKKKAYASMQFIENEEVIIASDCVVILENEIYGKPENYDDAVRIIKKLSGKMHEVITGVCILSKEKEVCFSGISKVYFKTLTDAEIAYYVEKYKPYDKAGAYAIQEWIGLTKISKIEGTYSNIMGLPMDLVYDALINF